MGAPEEQDLIAYLDSPEFVKASSNSTRLVSKLKTAVQSKELYETHQIIRTVYFRFSNYKEKLPALLELLYRGTVYLLHYQEFVSGQDIALLLLEIGAKCLKNQLEDKSHEAKMNLNTPNISRHMLNKTLDFDICQKVSNIAIDLPNDENGQTKFLAEALKILHPRILNQDLLHNTLADKFCYFIRYPSARYHYLHCANLENAENIANLLVDYHSLSATKSEVDLFITQFIFQLLCLQSPQDSFKTTNQSSSRQSLATPPDATVRRRTRKEIRSIAEKIFSAYTLRHPQLSQVDVPFSTLPLLNFTYFILGILDAIPPEAAVFKVLCDIYKVSWMRDPNYQSYLSRIGTLYFGIVDQAKQQNQHGFFHNMMMSLLEGADEDGEDSTPERNIVSSCDDLD